MEGRPVIISGDRKSLLKVWDLENGSQIGRPFVGHAGWVRTVAVGRLYDRSVVVSGSDDATIRIWDLATEKVRGAPLFGHKGRLNSIALAKMDGKPVIVSGGEDASVRVWDLDTGDPIGEPLTVSTGPVLAVVVTHDLPYPPKGSIRIIAGSRDIVSVWTFSKPELYGSHWNKELAINVGARILDMAASSPNTLVIATELGVLAFKLARPNSPKP